MNMLNQITTVASSVGAAALLGSAIIAPNQTPALWGALGGLGLGSLAASSVTNKKRDIEAEALRIAKAFSKLYEDQRGFVSTEQLAIEAEINLADAQAYVNDLQVEFKALPVETKSGVYFSFPHPRNALDELSENAKNWAANQQQELLQQIKVLNTKVISLEQQKAGIPPTSLKSSIPPSQEIEDAW